MLTAVGRTALLSIAILVAVAVAGCGAKLPLSPGLEPGLQAGVTDTAAAAALTEALTYVGVPYLYGGQDRNGVDCSGLVVAAYRSILPQLRFRQADGSLAPDAGALALYLYNADPVPLAAAKSGDLLFMDSDLDGVVDHVGLLRSFSGDTVTYVHATASAGEVKLTTRSISDGWWGQAFRGAGRLRIAL